jgi:hypothetical protein
MTKGDDVLPVVFILSFVGRGEDREDVARFIEQDESILVVYENGKGDLINKDPLLSYKAIINQMQKVQRHNAGQQRENPRKTDDVDIDIEVLEQLIEIVNLVIEMIFDFGNMRIALSEVYIEWSLPLRYMVLMLMMKFLKMAKLLISSLT